MKRKEKLKNCKKAKLHFADGRSPAKQTMSYCTCIAQYNVIEHIEYCWKDIKYTTKVYVPM